MKKVLKKILPAWVIARINRWRFERKVHKCFDYDFKRYVTYSNQTDTEESLLALMQLECHAVEKGFTMPDFRAGFGVTHLQALLKMCRDFIVRYGKKSDNLHQIIKVIYEYKLCHHNLDIAMPDAVAREINDLLAEFPSVSSDQVQLDCSKEGYFASAGAPFAEFARSRHSVRDFSPEPVDMETVKSAISLAQCAPSACNRQPTRVVIISDKEKIAKIFALHGGNRGFGHTVDKLLLIAGYLPGYRGGYERNWSYLDNGIFTMNLVYALHHYKIGSVILNWNMQQENNYIFYDYLGIPREWTVSVMVAIGNVPEQFKVCSSPKKALKDITWEI